MGSNPLRKLSSRIWKIFFYKINYKTFFSKYFPTFLIISFRKILFLSLIPQKDFMSNSTKFFAYLFAVLTNKFPYKIVQHSSPQGCNKKRQIPSWKYKFYPNPSFYSYYWKISEKLKFGENFLGKSLAKSSRKFSDISTKSNKFST